VSGDRQWTLGAKLALVAAPFALLALGAIAALVWMAWQLDGGAAAVNEAGRMRMQAYRLVLSADGGQTVELKRGIDAFERSLSCCARAIPTGRCSFPGTPGRAPALPASSRTGPAFASAWLPRPRRRSMRRSAPRPTRSSRTSMPSSPASRRTWRDGRP
jgi:two-component system nitrate/nitrite sensor histidine kinase NarX